MKRPYVDHLGIIVDNLDQAIELFERMFDLKPSKIKEMADVGLRIARLKAENIDIELIQYTSEENFGKRVMGPEKGVNHISINVEDMDAVLRDLEEKGIKTKEGFPRAGSHGLVAFFEPDTTEGILLEVCEG
ncbi:MAG: VOC family protein [Desulfobacteraceae bacterium]|nr:VOC family protein [Desulfobacteraceae bacterium]